MTSTATERPTLPAVGDTVQFIPADHPLYFQGRDRVPTQHSLYSGTFRPTSAVVDRVERDFITDGTPSDNVHVTFTDDEGRSRSTWVHASEIAQPRQWVPDFSAIDAATTEMLRETRLVGTAAMPGELRRNLQDAIRAAVRQMVTDYLGGTRWSTVREAGRACWTIAYERGREGGRGFSTNASTLDEACDQMGTWLHTTILPLAEQMPAPAPVETAVQTLNEESWPAWETTLSGAAVPAYTRDGMLVMVDQVHDDGSVTAYMPNGMQRAFSHSTDLRRITGETRLEVTSDDDHLGQPVGATVYYVSTHNGRRDREQAINVADYPNAQPGDHLGYKYLRNVKVHAEQPEPVPVVDATVVVDGVEYVRKDVIDRDVKHMVETLHKGAVDNGLCPVYDKTQRAVDAGTQFIKMGSRYRTFDVVVEQVITVRRTIRMEENPSEDVARDAALRVARDFPLRTVEPRYGSESVRVIRTDTATHHSTSPVT